MAVQQETIIGEDELDAIMAQLEEETAGMVAPPPAVVKTLAIHSDDDDLTGLDLNDDADALKAAEKAPEGGYISEEQSSALVDDLAGLEDTIAAGHVSVVESIAAANAASTVASLDDELAGLEAEIGGVTPPPANPMDKLNAMAAKAKEKYPSDVPKAASVTAAPDPIPEAAIARTDPAVVKPVKNLDEELANIAATLKPAGKIAAALPEEPVNPNPPPEPAPTKRPGAALAGLDFHIDVDQFRRDIAISEINLDNKMMEQAGNFAYYAERAARAAAQAKRTKTQVEMGEAKLYGEHRRAAMAKAAIDPAFKVTEKAIESAMREDPRYGAMQNRLIEAEQIADIAKGCVEAMKQNRDMIIQLGADRREDGKGQVRILAAESSHADLKARAVAAAKGA